jgi:hypothetical protein
MVSGKKIVVGEDGWGRPRRVLDESGKRYGRLVVLDYVSSGRVSTKWRCQCDCGRVKVCRIAFLRMGNTVSCGCYRSSGLNRLPRGEASFNQALSHIRWGAKRRGLRWALTRDQARALMTDRCHYCGVPPSNVCKGPNGNFRWNGIDQRVPGGGYTLKNSLPCCKSCNRLKQAVPYELFISRCVRIALWTSFGSDHPGVRGVVVPLLREFKAKVSGKNSKV